MKTTHVNEAKASMDHIYDNPDPREYFRELGSLDYTLPGVAKHLFQVLISHLQRNREEAVNILDLGCSYGVNAALLKHDLSMKDLYSRWGQERFEDATSEEVLASDRKFFSRSPEHEDIRVLGLDAAENAVVYAEDSGLLDEGLVVDLESESLPAPGAADLMPVNLVISTGCVGYVTDTTFHRLVPAVLQGESPWFANFALRTFSFEAIARVLADSDYVTERVEGCTFKQRRFVSTQEQEAFVRQVESRGLDASGKEADGYSHAEFYLSRPKEEAESTPIEAFFRLASSASGAFPDIDDGSHPVVRVDGQPPVGLDGSPESGAPR